MQIRLIKEAIREMLKVARNVHIMEGHFVRRMDNIADYSVSKSVDSLVKKSNLKPFYVLRGFS